MVLHFEHIYTHMHVHACMYIHKIIYRAGIITSLAHSTNTNRGKYFNTKLYPEEQSIHSLQHMVNRVLTNSRRLKEDIFHNSECKFVIVTATNHQAST